MKKELFSNEECINILQQAQQYYNKNFTIKEFERWLEENAKPIASITILKRFGTWNQAKKAAGIPIYKTKRKTLTSKQKINSIVPFIKRTVQEYDVFFTQENYIEMTKKYSDFPSYSTIINYVGSIKKAKELAGYNQDYLVEKMKKRCLVALKKCHQKYGDVNTNIYVNWHKEHPEYPSVTTIRKLFGSIKEATQSFEVDEAKVEKMVAKRESEQKKKCQKALKAFAKEEPNVSFARYQKWNQQNPEYPSSYTILKTFTTWKNALESLPFEILKENKAEDQKEKIKKAIKQASIGIEGNFTIRQYKQWREKHGGPSLSTVIKFYDSWSNALSVSGVHKIEKNTVTQHPKPFPTKEQCKAGLRVFYRETKQVAIAKYHEWQKNNPEHPSAYYIMKHFGMWTLAIDATLVKYQRQYSKEQVIELFNKVKKEIGNSISIKMYKDWAEKHNAPTYSKIIVPFESWSELQEACGIQSPPREKANGHNRITDESLIEAMQKAKIELGDGYSKQQYEVWRKKHKEPNSKTIFNRFGSWKKAKKIAGLSHRGKLMKNEEKLEDHYYQKAIDLTRESKRITYKKLKEELKISSTKVKQIVEKLQKEGYINSKKVAAER